MSEAEFRRIPESTAKIELLDGELVVSPRPTYWNQEIVGRLIVALRTWAAAQSRPVTVGHAPLGTGTVGKPFWSTLRGAGYRYQDPTGEQGPVRSLVVRKTRNGTFLKPAAFIGTHSAGRAVIVGGDFNMRENREPDATILARLLALTGLTDACAALHCPQIRIDKFVYRSSDAIKITALSWRNENDIFVDGDGNPLSDHDPVAVRFGWAVE